MSIVAPNKEIQCQFSLKLSVVALSPQFAPEDGSK